MHGIGYFTSIQPDSDEPETVKVKCDHNQIIEEIYEDNEEEN